MQELCGRIALQTGVGLGLALRRKVPLGLVGVCILALLIANTVNLGADLGAVAAGGSLLSRGLVSPIWLVVPVALLILGLQLFAGYQTIFRTFKWLTLGPRRLHHRGLCGPPPGAGRAPGDVRSAHRALRRLHHRHGGGARHHHLPLPTLLAGFVRGRFHERRRAQDRGAAARGTGPRSGSGTH